MGNYVIGAPLYKNCTVKRKLDTREDGSKEAFSPTSWFSTQQIYFLFMWEKHSRNAVPPTCGLKWQIPAYHTMSCLSRPDLSLRI